MPETFAPDEAATKVILDDLLPLEGKPAGRLDHLRSFWVTVAGRRVHARVTIDPAPPGPTPIVLVHGLLVSGRYLIPTASRLAPDYRCFIPDLPGFGRSDKPDRVLSIAGLADALAEWMDAVGLPRAVLVGNSLGCQIIASFGRRHPEKVDRAVLIGPTMDRRQRNALAQVWRLLVDTPREPIAHWGIVAMDTWQIGPLRALRTFRHGLEHHLEDDLPFLRAPTLVVRGSRDPIAPQAWAEEVARLLPDGRLVVLPGSAHAANIHSPVALVRAIRAFLGDRVRGTGFRKRWTIPLNPVP